MRGEEHDYMFISKRVYINKLNIHICTYIYIHGYSILLIHTHLHAKQSYCIYSNTIKSFLMFQLADTLLRDWLWNRGPAKQSGRPYFFLFFNFYAIIIFPRTEHSLSSLIKQGLYDWSASISLKFLEETFLIGLCLAESRGKLWIILPWRQLTVWPDFQFFETKVQNMVRKTTKNTHITNYKWL